MIEYIASKMSVHNDSLRTESLALSRHSVPRQQETILQWRQPALRN